MWIRLVLCKCKEERKVDQQSGKGDKMKSTEAPDGGYGWVIVASAFIVYALLDGIFSVNGVLFPHFVAYFNEGRGQIATIGSVLGGCLLLSGPLISSLVTCFGCRAVSMVGGFLTTVGMLLAAMSTNAAMLVASMGFLTGMGLSMLYLPAVVMTGFYFERRRALASGIGSAGSGVGMFIMAPITAFLMKNYDWRNCLVLLAGLSLHSVIAGAVLRPLTPRHKRVQTNDIDSESDKRNNASKCDVDQNVFKKDENELTKTVGNGISKSDEALNVQTDFDKTNGSNKCYDKTKKLYRTQTDIHEPSMVTKHFEVKHSQSTNASLHFFASSPHLKRKDIFYSGSLHNIALHNESSDNPLHGSVSSVNKSTCIRQSKKHIDLSLFMNIEFLSIFFANAFWQMGYLIPTIFVPDYSLSVGINESLSSILLSIIGAAMILGRGLGGFLGNLPTVNPILITLIAHFIAGITFVAVPFCTRFHSIAICVAVIGFMLGPIVPLTTVFLVDSLGLDKLTKAVGLVSMVKGVMCFVGAPLAGILYDVTGSYLIPFALGGTLYICSGLALCVLFYLRKRKT